MHPSNRERNTQFAFKAAGNNNNNNQPTSPNQEVAKGSCCCCCCCLPLTAQHNPFTTLLSGSTAVVGEEGRKEGCDAAHTRDDVFTTWRRNRQKKGQKVGETSTASTFVLLYAVKELWNFLSGLWKFCKFLSGVHLVPRLRTKNYSIKARIRFSQLFLHGGQFSPILFYRNRTLEQDMRHTRHNILLSVCKIVFLSVFLSSTKCLLPPYNSIPIILSEFSWLRLAFFNRCRILPPLSVREYKMTL